MLAGSPWSMVYRRAFLEPRSTENSPLEVPTQSRPSYTLSRTADCPMPKVLSQRSRVSLRVCTPWAVTSR